MEVLFAFAIIGIGLGTSLTLLLNAGIQNRRTELQAVAANLARETIEVARGIRDSNWLAGRTFDAGLVAADPADVIGVPVFNPATTPATWALDFSGSDAAGSADNRLYYRSGPAGQTDTNVYQQQVGGVPSPAGVTQFRRWFRLLSICASSEATLTLGPCPLNDKVGLAVQSFVEWTDRGQTRAAQLEERLYDWRVR